MKSKSFELEVGVHLVGVVPAHQVGDNLCSRALVETGHLHLQFTDELPRGRVSVSLGIDLVFCEGRVQKGVHLPVFPIDLGCVCSNVVHLGQGLG